MRFLARASLVVGLVLLAGRAWGESGSFPDGGSPPDMDAWLGNPDGGMVSNPDGGMVSNPDGGGAPDAAGGGDEDDGGGCQVGTGTTSLGALLLILLPLWAYGRPRAARAATASPPRTRA